MAPVRPARLRVLFTAVLLSAGSSGCLSGAMQLGATPTPRGATEWGVSVNGLLHERGRRLALLPSPELSWRHGRDEDSDFGVRAYLLGLEAGTRHRLLVTPRFTLGAAPSFELAYTPVTNNTTELLHARLHGSLLGDWRVAPRWCLSLAGRLTWEGAGPLTALRGLADGASWIAQPSGAAGVTFDMASGTRVRLEAGVGVPIDLSQGPRRPVAHAGFAVQWAAD
jgi:hypothetical protein